MLRSIALAAAAASLTLLPAPTSAEDCATLLHLHGYLTVAVVKCRLVEASSIIDAASACRAQSGRDNAARTATDGIRFALGEIVAKGGEPGWCKFVQSQYPSLVRPRP